MGKVVKNHNFTTTLMLKFCFGYFSQVLVAWNLSLVKLLNYELFGGLQKQFVSKGFTLYADATL